MDQFVLSFFKQQPLKKNLSPILGLDGYKDILSKMKRQGVNIPIVAIGGIRYDDIIPLMGIGIDGIAVSGSILQTDNPAEEMKRWIDQ